MNGIYYKHSTAMVRKHEEKGNVREEDAVQLREKASRLILHGRILWYGLFGFEDSKLNETGSDGRGCRSDDKAASW